jgi:hypothetical protein
MTEAHGDQNQANAKPGKCPVLKILPGFFLYVSGFLPVFFPLCATWSPCRSYMNEKKENY